MRRLMLLSSAAAVLFAVGCTSPAEVCESGVELRCEREFECNPNKGSDAFTAAFGTSVDNCKEILAARIGCSQRDDQDQNCVGADGATPTGEKFQGVSKAAECRDDREKLSCQNYLAQYYPYDESKFPQSCQDLCQPK